jgi:ATP-dependent RNA helicase DDX55/SPB4
MWNEFKLEYNIDERLDNVMKDGLGFDKITKVQQAVIPHFIRNKDVIVKAMTGSGKTLSYLIPLFQKLIKKKEAMELPLNWENNILSLIILPSR